MSDFSCELLEEGEIIDDDFEDISDNSIIDASYGKCVSVNAISLSSSDENSITVRPARKLLHQRKHKLRKRKRRRVSSDSSQCSDSELLRFESLKGKLQEALRIDGPTKAHQKPLHKRLLAMTGQLEEPELPIPEAPPAPIISLDKTDDTELETLRIEALKTAFLNKCQQRKRKKAMEEQKEQLPKHDADKENDTPAQKEEDIDEDEDVLRAALLAGLSKKITEIQEPPKVAQPPKQFIVKTNLFAKKILPKGPKVKPLIIKVTNNSETDEDSDGVVAASISLTVDRFLKEQRAKFDAAEVVEKPTPKANLDKSAVKLLSKSQQIEYQQLLKKLKNAEKMSQMKKVAEARKIAVIEPNPVVALRIENRDSTTTTPALANNENPPESKEKEVIAEKKQSGIINELTILKRTLRELKVQRNERRIAIKAVPVQSFQIKDKYQVLTPVIKKITAASNERKQQEQRIKELLQELKQTREKLAKSHDNFSKLVRELVSKKGKIDKSIQDTQNRIKIAEAAARLKELAKKKVLPATSTPIKLSPKKESNAEATSPMSSIVANSVNHDVEDMDVCNSDETDSYQIDIMDPNDIDQIYKRKPVKSILPDYVSPLNQNGDDRYNQEDPYGIMCPYEVNGSCRDRDCSYKHYTRSLEQC